MLKKLKQSLAVYLDDLLLIAGGVCFVAAAACYGRAQALGVAGACLIAYGRLVARASLGRWRK